MPIDHLQRRLGQWIGVAPALRENPEYQSALVRLTACLLGALYIGLGASTGYYTIVVPYYLALFPLYLLSNVAFLRSVTHRPEWQARRYLGICLDVIAISLAIFITREAISPFYLLYILIFISAGTRFGKSHLVVASVVAVIAYNFVLIGLDEWHKHSFEAAFFLLLLVLLPLYQYSLLRQVQQAREEAERADRAKGEFLAVMTHELRTPLSGVAGMSELLKSTRLDHEQREYVQSIASSANVLGMLIGDILDLSKIDARQLQLEQIALDPRMVVREVCETLGPQAFGADLELICDVDITVPQQLNGDPLRLRQILFNLIGNAIKFTETGEVVVRLSTQSSEPEHERTRLLIEVEDTGIGISKEQLPFVFERFRQADESTTRRYGGSGLGTTIARELTLLMGGQIGVDSEPGKGSRFWVDLPLLAPTPPRTSPTGAESLPGCRALIVVPNATLRGLICCGLQREGADCHCIASPAETTSLNHGLNDLDLAVIDDSTQEHEARRALTDLEAILVDRVPTLLLTRPGQACKPLGRTSHRFNKPLLIDDLVAAAGRIIGRSGDGTGDDTLGAPVWMAAPRRPDIPVLVAEDNAIAARVVTTFLKKMGYDPTRVADGEAALDAALSGAYRLAIVDLHMPKLDGLDFARSYRAQAGDAAIPIVALTANAAEEVRQRCQAAGMSDFLAKPVTPIALRETLERLIG